VSQRRLRAVAAAIVLVPLLAFPLAVTAADGLPTFPSRDDCARPATGDAEDLEVVYGRLDSPVAAQELLDRVLATGFAGAEIELDACGRWKVSYDAIDTFAQGQGLVEQAREAGFDPRVEHEG
jgi:hypothetical protein